VNEETLDVPAEINEKLAPNVTLSIAAALYRIGVGKLGIEVLRALVTAYAQRILILNSGYSNSA
jgi:hypothetical protein